MNINTYFSIVASLICWLLAIFTYIKRDNSPIKKSFALVTILIGTWTLFPFISVLSSASEKSLFFSRLIYIPAIFVPSTFFSFMFYIMGPEIDKKGQIILKASYFISLFFLVFIFSPLFIRNIVRFEQSFAIIPGPIYVLFILYFGFMYFSAQSLTQVQAFPKMK